VKGKAPDAVTEKREVVADPAAIAAAQSALEREQAQQEADAKGETETIEVDLVKLDIVRDNTRTRIEVLEHEVPIYELIHGEENVQEAGATKVRVADMDPQIEYDALLRKFGKNGEEAVRRTFPAGPADIARELGISLRKTERDADGNTVKRRKNKSGEQAMIVDFADPNATPADEHRPRRIIRTPVAKRSTKS
jgi:hypothetical protein